MTLRSFGLFVLIALVGAFAITRLIQAPGYTDVYYHLNAANRLVSGQGLTDAYAWTYIGALDRLPMPSHLYWMPLTSVLAALGMGLLGAPGDYAAAQLPFVLAFAAAACVGYWLGWRIGGTRRHAWVAGLLTLFSGLYTKFWGEIDTFAPYALVGSLCLVAIGLASKPAKYVGERHTSPARRSALLWLIAGALAGLGHLTRADGLLLLIVGAMVIMWRGIRPHSCEPSNPKAGFVGASLPLSVGEGRQTGARQQQGEYEGRHAGLRLRGIVTHLVLLAAGYGLVMLPFFARNGREIGTPLPLGGTQAIWFREYNDLFNYPPQSSPATLFADGLGAFISSRREALVNNLGTFIAVEGLVALTPLMLIGLWKRRRDPFLLAFWLYALGLHLAMTFVFPFPGYRGGLLHSAAALIPFWAALGIAGLDDVIEWVAKRRRRWKAGTAKVVFSGGLVALAVGLSVYIGVGGRVEARAMPPLYAELSDRIAPDALVLTDDPAELYYYTGRGGATLPNGTPETLLAVARRYNIGYLLLKHDTAAIPAGLLLILNESYGWLTPLPFNSARLYAIQLDP